MGMWRIFWAIFKWLADNALAELIFGSSTGAKMTALIVAILGASSAFFGKLPLWAILLVGASLFILIIGAFEMWAEFYRGFRPALKQLAEHPFQLSHSASLEKAHEEIAELKRRQSARTISDSELAEFSHHLWRGQGHGRNIRICYLPTASDGYEYAKRIKKGFKDAEWKVEEFNSLSGPDGIGVWIMGSDEKFQHQPGLSSERIIEIAFQQIGINPLMKPTEFVTDGLAVVVARKDDD